MKLALEEFSSDNLSCAASLSLQNCKNNISKAFYSAILYFNRLPFSISYGEII